MNIKIEDYGLDDWFATYDDHLRQFLINQMKDFLDEFFSTWTFNVSFYGGKFDVQLYDSESLHHCGTAELIEFITHEVKNINDYDDPENARRIMVEELKKAIEIIEGK